MDNGNGYVVLVVDGDTDKCVDIMIMRLDITNGPGGCVGQLADNATSMYGGGPSRSIQDRLLAQSVRAFFLDRGGPSGVV